MQLDNKLSVIIWKVFLFFLSMLFLTGCSDEEVGTDNETDESVIAFDCSSSILPTTKTIAADMQYFRVSAIWNKGNARYEPFMNNQLVEKQGNHWIYSPIKYWPGYGSISFFAYSPAISSGIEVLHIDSTINQISIEYIVSKNYQEQEDFMVATNLNKTINPIQLDFKHVLSNVFFQVRSTDANATFRIKEIKLAQLYSKGILTGLANGSASTWMWYGSSALTDYVVYQKYPFETQGDTYLEVGNLVVLPQKPVNSFKIILSYDVIIAGISESKTNEYTLDDDFVFDMGKKYIFYLDLNT